MKTNLKTRHEIWFRFSEHSAFSCSTSSKVNFCSLWLGFNKKAVKPISYILGIVMLSTEIIKGCFLKASALSNA